MTNLDNKVLLGGQPAAELRDAEASGAVTPGYLVEFDGAAAEPTESLQAHATAAEKYNVMVADIVPYSGDNEGATAPVDDDYADGDYLKAFVPNTANRCNLVAGEALSVGDKLVSGGDGTVRALDTAGGDDPSGVLFVARSATDAAGDRVIAERV